VPGRILVDFFCSMVRTTFFAPDETSTLSRAEKDAATARKPLVESAFASASGVGHPVVGTAAVEAGTGTSREVGIGAADSAAGLEAAVGAAAVEAGTGTSREVGIGAADLAAGMEAAVGAAAVGTGTGTSREVGIGPAESAEGMEKAVNASAVKKGMGTSREVGMERQLSHVQLQLWKQKLAQLQLKQEREPQEKWA